MAKKNPKRAHRKRSESAVSGRTGLDGRSANLSPEQVNSVTGQPRPAPNRELSGPSSVTERWAVIVLLVVCSLNMASAEGRNPAVCDELGAHIPPGYVYWTSGVYSGGIGDFPLGQMWISAPVALTGLDYQLFTDQHPLLFRSPATTLGLSGETARSYVQQIEENVQRLAETNR